MMGESGVDLHVDTTTCFITNLLFPTNMVKHLAFAEVPIRYYFSS